MMTVLVCLICGLASPADDPWVEVLRGAQATNQAKTQQGSAQIKLRVGPPPSVSGEPIEIQAEIYWERDWFMERIKYRSSTDYYVNQQQPLALADAPWHYYLEGPSLLAQYSPSSKIFAVGPANPRPIIPEYLSLQPLKTWYSCCPPSTGSSRPWSEMLDLRIRDKDGITTHNTYKKLDSSQILQTRTDPNGSVMSIIYSLEQGGNPLKITTVPANKQRQPTTGSYQWRRVDDAFVLDSCNFTTASLQKPSEIETYHLSVTHVSLAPNPPSIFDWKTLARTIKGRTQGDCTLNYAPNSTLRKYSVLQAAVSRLFFTPTFALVSFFSRLNAIRRNAPRFAGASSLHVRF